MIDPSSEKLLGNVGLQHAHSSGLLRGCSRHKEAVLPLLFVIKEKISFGLLSLASIYSSCPTLTMVSSPPPSGIYVPVRPHL